MIRDGHLGSWISDWDPGFFHPGSEFFHPGSRGKKALDLGSRILDPDPQH